MTTSTRAFEGGNRLRAPIIVPCLMNVSRPTAALLVLLTIGCVTAVAETPNGEPAPLPAAGGSTTEAMVLQAGDVIKLALPGAQNLDTVQTIRRDGKIALALIGEVQAAGLTPAELQKNLQKLYAPQLVSSEVIVTVVSSNFSAFVTGAVLRPGKITSERPITALQAIMEAGGFDYGKANLRAVVVIRQDESGKTHRFPINVKQILDGKGTEAFYLKPSDIVFVPERFSLF